MDKERNYIDVLVESLKKKVSILDGIIQENEKQKEAVSEEKFNDAVFEETLKNKDGYIEELNRIDEGFDTVYERVKPVLGDEKQKLIYKDKILQMKELIKSITDRTLKIQQQERLNEKLVLKKLSMERSDIVQVKNMRKAASNYYKSMNKVNYIDPQFMDRKE